MRNEFWGWSFFLACKAIVLEQFNQNSFIKGKVSVVKVKFLVQTGRETRIIYGKD